MLFLLQLVALDEKMSLDNIAFFDVVLVESFVKEGLSEQKNSTE
jgi:hypothetical protein